MEKLINQWALKVMLENIMNCEGKNCDREKEPRQWVGYEWWDVFSREWLLMGNEIQRKNQRQLTQEKEGTPESRMNSWFSPKENKNRPRPRAEQWQSQKAEKVWEADWSTEGWQSKVSKPGKSL